MGAGGEGDFGGAAAENRDRNDIATGFTVLDLSSDGNLNECLACFGGDKLTLTCRTIKLGLEESLGLPLLVSRQGS